MINIFSNSVDIYTATDSTNNAFTSTEYEKRETVKCNLQADTGDENQRPSNRKEDKLKYKLYVDYSTTVNFTDRIKIYELDFEVTNIKAYPTKYKCIFAEQVTE